MDNHESRISLDVINLARENGAHYNTSVDQWMKDDPGTPMSTYDISGCFDVAFERAMTPTNILASFSRTGIVPFDHYVFTDPDFLPTSVTDRPMPTILNTTVGVNLMSATAEGSSTNKESKKLDENTYFISPKEFIGYPKAKPRKENPNKRRRVVSCILTDTPQKEDLERKEEENNSKKIKKPKLDLHLPSSSAEESEPEMSDHESSGGEFCPSPSPPAMDLVLNRDLKINDFVLVKFAVKWSDADLFYVGRVLTISENQKEFCVSFLRRSNKISNSFIYPTVQGESIVMKADISMTLPEPVATARTKRQGRFITLEINFDENVLQSRLMEQFFNCVKDPSEEDITAHVARLQRNFSELNDELKKLVTTELPELLLMSRTISKLPSEYLEFTRVWEFVSLGERTINKLTERLMGE
ncbi:hypothetical protein ILUMI_09491 [Ignelater luminosus]|uniref:Uncharacterized protein n=1 Tax=Ignelater luminosus TaxID=2038154 RepID=A0A8K0D444_IGNLU|nr:hypothetical protein ILUMI_09491 [Ignelater luminosus]